MTVEERDRVRRGGPWRGWYHVMTSTRGAWLPGDRRGWRSWRGLERCDGDYNNPPPPGEHADRLARSRAARKRPPVILSPLARTAACGALADKLLAQDSSLLAVAVTAVHAHALCRCCNYEGDGAPRPDAAVAGLHPRNALADGRDPFPRHVFGRAKGHAARELLDAGLKEPGPLWGRRSQVKSIGNRGHAVNTLRYILNHYREERAAVWDYRSGLIPAPGAVPKEPR